MSIFESEIPDISSHCASSMDSLQLRLGRPYGGCGILGRNDLLLEVTPVTSNSKRISSVSVKLDSSIFLLCTVYMPCSTNVPTVDTYTDVIQSLVQLTSNSAYDFIVIGGDFNCCLANTAKGPAKHISDFVDQEHLFSVSNTMHSCTIDYTFESKTNAAQTFLDHFIVSKNLQECIETYHVCK